MQEPEVREGPTNVLRVEATLDALSCLPNAYSDGWTAYGWRNAIRGSTALARRAGT
jgi:hypothetical protein